MYKQSLLCFLDNFLLLCYTTHRIKPKGFLRKWVKYYRSSNWSQKRRKLRFSGAAKHILQKHGYEALSIKNICEEAGVSNGSFYHHFKTKDDLLSYYIEEQPNINPDLLDIPKSADELNLPLYMSIWIMCIIARNSALNLWRIIILRKTSLWTHWSVPNVRTRLWLYTIICRNVSVPGIPSPNQDIEDITTDIRMIVIGNVFEWCLKEGNADFEGNMKRSLESYMNGVF